MLLNIAVLLYEEDDDDNGDDYDKNNNDNNGDDASAYDFLKGTLFMIFKILSDGQDLSLCNWFPFEHQS